MVLLIGYGNPGRGDDGLGPALADRIAQRRLPYVTVKTNYQLTVEDALDLIGSDIVVFADARIGGSDAYDFSPAHPDATADIGSHALSAGAVLSLADLLFGARPSAFILGISGTVFGDVREGLSEDATKNLDLAERFLLGWLTERAEADGSRVAG